MIGGILGAITGLIGAGLQAQAQQDQLMFQYAKFNWEKQRANTQDRFASASRADQFGNVTKYDPISNEWNVNLTPNQKEIMTGGEKEKLIELKEDIPAARKVKRAVQERAAAAKEPFYKAASGYKYDQPASEGALRAELTGLLSTGEEATAKAGQSAAMRAALRLGKGGSAKQIIDATDAKLGDPQNMAQRMLKARQEALKEFGARTQQHELKWGKPMEMWGSLMAQGGDLPQVPKNNITDPTGGMSDSMMRALQSGTTGVSGALGSLATAAGQYPDLSKIISALSGIDKAKGKGGDDTEDSTYKMGYSSYEPAYGDRNEAGVEDSYNYFG